MNPNRPPVLRQRYHARHLVDGYRPQRARDIITDRRYSIPARLARYALYVLRQCLIEPRK